MSRFGVTFTMLIILLIAGCASNRGLMADKDAEIASLKKQVADAKIEQTKQTNEADELVADLNRQLADLRDKGQVWITEKDNMTIITLPNAALFASGSVTLSPEGQKVSDDIWKTLVKYPDRDISIQGYTDNVPIAKKFKGRYKSNWELSSARAHTVLHYVMTKHDVKPNRLSAVGFGEFHPIADNKTENGRMKNRRVVIAVGPKA